ncbi:MAG: hypothetical protein M9924_19405 [Rhizobiaceae bacterium]|nr:hypothetical protein [Rhizobiaceae bacterium]
MASLKRPLYLTGAGAVTPAGLDARQTLAAIRASLSSFEEMTLTDPIGATQIVARIPTRHNLRRTQGEWLVNMAARAIREAVHGIPPQTVAATALFIALPENFRNHPAFEDIPPRNFLAAVSEASGHVFHPASRAIDGGAAVTIGLAERAVHLMEEEGVAQILLGGVDSLVNKADLTRLGQAGRLKGPDNGQGLVPGEAAVFVCLTRDGSGKAGTAVAVSGIGIAQEADSVLSDRYSQGRAMLGALRNAASGPGPSEPDIDFIVSNSNGERYAGIETLIAGPRFYRTRRDMFPIAYPAMTVGEIGAAGGALALMLAADSFRNGYAPGPVAMCEVASESGLRAAAIASAVRRR